MRVLILSLVSLLLVPKLAFAESFREIVNGQIVGFVDTAVIPLLYVFAFLFFIMGVFQYFFTDNEEKRQQGRQFVLWGVIGLVVIFSVWGIVRLLLGVIGGV